MTKILLIRSKRNTPTNISGEEYLSGSSKKYTIVTKISLSTLKDFLSVIINGHITTLEVEHYKGPMADLNGRSRSS